MIAIVFPGQGSQKPSMGQSLYESFPIAKETFERVSQALDQDIAALCFESSVDVLRETHNAQLALYTCGVAAYQSLCQELCPETLRRVRFMAGHSIGEYAALASAGIVSLEEGARLVATRGALMQEAGQNFPGTMSAVLGLDREIVDKVCREAEGVVVVANDNSLGQVVISGEVLAVADASRRALEAGAKRVLPLNVSGAFHSPLLSDVAQRMGKALKEVVFTSPTDFAVYSNVTARPVLDANQYPELLQQQLEGTVRWTETVQQLAADGVTQIVECGSGEVLCGLIRRIDKSLQTFAAQDVPSLNATALALGSKTGTP
jgi:[acyl-carrier-protein] S-malonyltransferase